MQSAAGDRDPSGCRGWGWYRATGNQSVMECRGLECVGRGVMIYELAGIICHFGADKLVRCVLYVV